MSGPAGSEPDPEGRDARAEDDVWRDIVAHYGERPELPADAPDDVVPLRRAPVPGDHDGEPTETRDRDEERYVPPPAPPAPLPQGPRAVAWLGLFGAPAVMLIFIVFGLTMPGWVAFVLFVAFVGGFGYLVATMRKHDDSDPWDDGAVL